MKNSIRIINHNHNARSTTINQRIPQTRARQGPILRVEIPRSEKSKKSLLFHGVNLWNCLPSDIRLTEDINAFKSAIKRTIYSTQHCPTVLFYLEIPLITKNKNLHCLYKTIRSYRPIILCIGCKSLYNCIYILFKNISLGESRLTKL